MKGCMKSMKKLLMLGMLGIVLFLGACSSRMSGETTTVCTSAPSTQVSRQEIVETVVTIEGMDEEILMWTERMVFDRDDYLQYFFQMDLTDEEIRDIFDTLEHVMGDGLSWHIISLSEDTIELEFVYNYEEMSISDLNYVWGTDNFEREVTLTGAIAGLEEEGAVCQTD